MLPWIKKNRDELIVGLILTVVQVFSEAYFQSRGAVPEPTEPIPIGKADFKVTHRPDPVKPPEPPRKTARDPKPKSAPLPPGWERVISSDFDVYVLYQHYAWKRGSSDEVLTPAGKPTKELQQEMYKLVSQPQWNYGDLITVGTASCEGEPAEEEMRAQERARQIAIWIQSALHAVGRRHEIHTLSLGKYSKDCSDSDAIRSDPRRTDVQRRVILIASKSQNVPPNLASTLKDLMRKSRPFGIHPDDYTEFVLNYWREHP